MKNKIGFFLGLALVLIGISLSYTWISNTFNGRLLIALIACPGAALLGLSSPFWIPERGKKK